MMTAKGIAINALLLDCLHPSCLALADADKVRHALDILHRIYHNMIEYPHDEKFRSVRITGTSWELVVLPVFYPLQLYDWMGAALDGSERVRLVQGEGAALLTLERLAEVDALRSAWLEYEAAPAASVGECQASASPLAVSEWLRHVSSSTISEGAWELVHRYCMLSILLTHMSTTIIEASVRERIEHALSDERCSALNSYHPNGQHSNCLAATSIPQMTEEYRVISSERHTHHEKVTKAEENEEHGLGEKSLTQRRRQRQREASERVSAKHKEEMLRDTLRGIEAQTGAPYRALSEEEKRAGLACIADIANLMEQFAILTESQKIVRHDRIAARSLLAQFKLDGDLMSLHAQQGEWEDKVEDAKATAGKTTVYL